MYNSQLTVTGNSHDLQFTCTCLIGTNSSFGARLGRHYLNFGRFRIASYVEDDFYYKLSFKD